MSEELAETDSVDYMETDLSPSRNGEDTPSPQFNEDSPKVGSEVEGSPEPEQGDGDQGRPPNCTDKDHDPCQSEGTLVMTISNINKLSDQSFSEPVFIRNLPWRLMVMPREVNQDGEKVKCLGIFVQCNPKSPESMSWNVTARAKITIVNWKDPENNHSREIHHCFCARENDWGYSNLMAMKDVLDESKGFVLDDQVSLQAIVEAEAPHGIHWDSRKHTGFVGLKNQGATCYMNSLLQTLYCTNKLRKAVYLMPTDSDDPVKSVPLALQRLFYELQHNDKPVGTKKLTKSFGWDTLDIFMQHDIQELSRVLLDNIENKMKGTLVEGTIPALFEGQMESYIRCTQVDYVSSRLETFFDIQLNVKEKKNVIESFRDYVEVETMDGENKYDAGEHGLQEAKKGVVFVKLPPVLHLHLMRFQYDPITDSNIKLNDRYEFPVNLDLEKFLKVKEDTPARYTLHAVLVHSGDNYGGHYVAYLNPGGKGTWLKFDDDVVSTCSRKDAIENNFGGSDDALGIRNCTNAYMLVYVRDSCLDNVLQEVVEKDISESLKKRFAEEKLAEMQRRKERSEAHLYMSVDVYLEDDFQGHQGSDLVDMEEVKPKTFRILKISSFSVFHQSLANTLGYTRARIRVWPFEKRSNGTIRPTYVDKPNDVKKSIFQHADMKPKWSVFVETLSPEAEHLDALPSYDCRNHVLLFYKYYDPTKGMLMYMGHIIVPVTIKFVDLFPLFCEKACIPVNTPLALFEEIKPNLVERIEPAQPLCSDEDVRDGDILCYQREDCIASRLPLPTVEDYFRDLYNRIVVTFYDKAILNDPGFVLTLNQRMGYPELAGAVARHLNTDPLLLQFFRPQLTQRAQFTDVAIRCGVEGCLREIVPGPRNRLESPLVLTYQRLTIPIHEFENKKWFRCVFVNSKLHEEKEFTVYVNKTGTVEELLNEAEKEITFSKDGTKCLRLLEVMTNRIVDIHPLDKPVSDLVSQKMYRVEEIPKEDMELEDSQALIPVAHFHKAAHNVFGVPFLLKITDGERLSSIKERVKCRLDVPDRDFEKWKFAILQTIAPFDYLSEEEDDSLFIIQFYISKSKGIYFPRLGMPWFGLDHINKNPKRVRYTFEKAIKIHN
ncbi:ubiquitin carboxyl-terminal hydrolase 7-like [Halichondria panicea]|uniref:ubiquitin carboxyl-terminal hydrolase 7-like n=1 Tax=Halichondria panicea TaxID=6063 RepID=UPI00312B9123